MALAKFQTSIPELALLQTSWAADLNPLLGSPLSGAQILKQVPLSVGTNVINHKLGRKLQGWVVVRQRASANIYDSQDSNNNPQLTLTLVSDAAVVIDLAVF